MSRKAKWLFVLAAFAALSVFIVFRTYYGIHAEVWKDNQQVTQVVYGHISMAKTVKVETFVGEDTIKIVHGEDAEGESIIVWIGEQNNYAAYTKDGIAKDDLLSRWNETDPGKKLLRIMPGKLNNRYVWEIFYSKNVNGKVLYYYDYFQFSDGSFVDTYLLTLK